MNKIYPLWKLIYQESLYGVNKVDEYIIKCKLDENSSWIKLYTTYNLPKAQLALIKLKEIFTPYIESFLQNNTPIMFSVNNQMFKTIMMLPFQSSVCGEYIDNNVAYGDRDEEVVKYDYIEDNICFYNEDEAVVFGNQLFINGNLILNHEKLKNICNNINQDLNYLDYDSENLIRYIKNTYPYVKSYTCKGYSNLDIQNY